MILHIVSSCRGGGVEGGGGVFCMTRATGDVRKYLFFAGRSGQFHMFKIRTEAALSKLTFIATCTCIFVCTILGYSVYPFRELLRFSDSQCAPHLPQSMAA
jgi:hypothetical protein